MWYPTRAVGLVNIYTLYSTCSRIRIGIWKSICFSKSLIILYVPFSWKGSALYTYLLFVKSNFNLLYNFQRITFPYDSRLVLYSIWASLRHSLIMWISHLCFHITYTLYSVANYYYYYYYCYFTPLRVFYTSVGWWFFTEAWERERERERERASLFTSSDRRSLLSILVDHNNVVVWMFYTGPLIYNPPFPVRILWGLFQVHQLELV